MLRKAFTVGVMTLATTLAIAGTDKKTSAPEVRKPASLENELMRSYILTADILSQARLANQTCNLDAYEQEILNLLSKVSWREDFAPQMLTHNIHEALKHNIQFKQIARLVDLSTAKNSKVVEKALENTYFESRAGGALGPAETLFFKAGGVVEHKLLSFDKDGQDFFQTFTGKWGAKLESHPYEQRIMRVWYTTNGKTKVHQLKENFDGTWTLKKRDTEKRKSEQDPSRIQFINLKESECSA